MAIKDDKTLIVRSKAVKEGRAAKMKVLIIGVGTFGTTLIKTLIKVGAEVIVVDKDESSIEQVKGEVSFAVTIDTKNSNEIETLPLNEIDYAVCCIGSDMEASLLTCLHLKEAGVTKIVARAVSNYHRKILESIGVDEIVFPEEEVGEKLGLKLVKGHVFNYIPLSENHVIVEVKPSEWMVGKMLRELKLREKYKVNVIAIKERDKKINSEEENVFIEKIIDVPIPDYVIKNGSIMMIVGSIESIEKMREEI